MSNRRVPPTGEIRQSQVITTFGPGSMVDLPTHSVLIGGLDHWQGERRRIYEERLENRLKDLLKVDELALYAPPVDDGDPNGPRTGITAFQFPTWFLAQGDFAPYRTPDGRQYRTRPLVPWDHLVKGCWLSHDRKSVPVVPVRFVQACVKGHISDVNWYAFVRGDPNAERKGLLWMDEGGAGNDFGEIYIRDERTGRRRPLSDASVPDSRVLGYCKGRQPWLGPRVWEQCDKPNRLLTRSASNAYFSQTLGVIAIPDTEAALREAVDQVYEDFLQYAESQNDIARERKKQKVFYALEGFTDEAVWAEVKRRSGSKAKEDKSIKQAEIETLISQPEGMGDDVPEAEFYARTRSPALLPGWLRGQVDRVVLVHRLREVVAQLGFTRFEAVMPDVDGELDLNVEPAPLARDLRWLPAVENRGEGIFIGFDAAAIDAWMKKPGVKRRGQQLVQGFDSWLERKNMTGLFPGLPYVMLHSLSHLLITAMSLECGYAASSIRERVYAGPYGYGILLYTGAPGAEGTLGGLVEVGRKIEHHLAHALELGRLCSNDPVCAQHDPPNLHEERFLHGAACHGCLLIAETSCERRNEFLDRSLVVPTVADGGAAFFDGAVTHTAESKPSPAPSPSEVWTFSDLAKRQPSEDGFLVQVDADEAPDRRTAVYRCEPIPPPLSDLREGSLILVQHPALTRGGSSVDVGAGRWMVREMRDAKSEETRFKLILRGAIPPYELDLSADEWGSFRPLGRLTRLEG